MTPKNTKYQPEWNVQEWFKKLDRFNAIEPFVLEREQPFPQERDPLNSEIGKNKDDAA
jgi:hypothetical protein